MVYRSHSFLRLYLISVLKKGDGRLGKINYSVVFIVFYRTKGENSSASGIGLDLIWIQIKENSLDFSRVILQHHFEHLYPAGQDILYCYDMGINEVESSIRSDVGYLGDFCLIKKTEREIQKEIEEGIDPLFVETRSISGP